MRVYRILLLATLAVSALAQNDTGKLEIRVESNAHLIDSNCSFNGGMKECLSL